MSNSTAVLENVFDLPNYVMMVQEARLASPEWRLGQAYFNVLSVMHPELAKEVRASNNDPFYADDEDDPRMKEFTKWLVERTKL